MTYDTPPIPKMTPWLLWGFQGYVTRYLRKHFNAVRLTRNSVPDLEADEPVIIFGNHPGWWDPLMACFLNRRLFHPRRAYSPIDGEALAQYPIFRRLGYYGIQMDSLQGAKQFLATSRAILHQPDSALWITPGGQFCDVRQPTVFQPGLGHLVASLERITVVPLALEYAFWEERTPEALAHFGPPLRCEGKRESKETWQQRLEAELAEAQDHLSQLSIQRDTRALAPMLNGSAGVGGCYDFARQVRSWLTGRRFQRRHSPGLGAVDA